MNKKRFIGTCVAVFVFMFAFDWLFHGVFLKSAYMATSHLWRSEAEMQMMCKWMIGGQILLSIMFSYIFLKGYERKGIGEGVRYGLLIWLLFTGPQLIMYAVTPYPFSLVMNWIGGELVKFIGMGAVAAAIYRPRLG